MRPAELCAVGAVTLSSHDLVRALVRRPLDDDELEGAVRALALVGPAREAAIRDLRCGPQLLAAVELGRRAWMLPSPAGRRVRNPVDVAAIVAPRAVDDAPETRFILALDVRLTLARVVRLHAPDPGEILRAVLAAGASRAIVASRQPAPAVPATDDVEEHRSLEAAAALVGVLVLDRVILGDDGFCSLARLGLSATAPDRRYR